MRAMFDAITKVFDMKNEFRRQETHGQHVYKIVVVHGKQFYGYSAGEHLFLKVFLYDPSSLNSIATLLRTGAILERPFVVLEVFSFFVNKILSFKSNQQNKQ